MIFDIKNKLGAIALAAGFLLGPALAHAQAADEPADTNSETAPGQEDHAAQAPQAATADDVPAQADGDDTGNHETPSVPAASDAAGGSQEVAQGDEAAEGPTQASPEEAAARVKAAFEKEFPGIALDHVKPTRFEGIYEVRIGSDLLYTNERVEYVMQGSLIDARSKEDLTAKSLDELMKVAFESLPLESAIKQVKGDGSRKMVVFEDPNCGYCKRLHQTLDGMDNYTVYTLLFPILSPDSTVKARNIWCAGDRAQAWRNVMLKNEAPPNGQCETPIEANLALGRKLLVRGTPAIIFEDGSRANGALPRDALEDRLNKAAAAVRG